MKLTDSMAEVLRLTRAGDLAGATAVLQSSFGGRPPAAPQPIDLRSVRDAIPGGSGAAPASDARDRCGDHDSLLYRLYLPVNVAPGMPLVVMLHGCTQSPEDFARGTAMDRLADELGFLVAYPGQTQAANPKKCWNWFKPGDQQRDRGEPALLAGITREVIAAHGVDPARVYVAGLSAGGAAAAIMAAAYPDLFAAVGIHSGLACGSARDVPSALMAMKAGGRPAPRTAQRFVPVITFHGDKDATVNEANSRAIISAASAAAGVALTTRAETGRTKGGRGWHREQRIDPHGKALIEQWTVHGSGHAWSGGDATGSYTDPAGPDASRAMLDFFLSHRRG